MKCIILYYQAFSITPVTIHKWVGILCSVIARGWMWMVSKNDAIYDQRIEHQQMQTQKAFGKNVSLENSPETSGIYKRLRQYTFCLISFIW